MEAKVLSGIVLYKQLDKFPKDLVAGYSPAFKTALNLYRKTQDDVEDLKDLQLALQAHRGGMPDTTFEKVSALIAAAQAAKPASGDIIREDYLAGKINSVIQRYVAGEEVSVEEEVESILANLPQTGVDEVDGVTDLREMLALCQVGSGGMAFPLEALNDRSRPSTPGDLLVIAALPNKGKTSLTAFLIAKGIDTAHPGKLLWLNNEGGSYKIRMRLISAFTGLSHEDLEKNPEAAQAAFEEARGQVEVKVTGIHGKTWRQVQDLIRHEKPTVCVIDMLDHVKAPAQDRKDLTLEYLYQDARQLAGELGCIIVASSQLTMPPMGSDTKFPTTAWLKDSKSGKEGAASSMILMGADPEHPNLRYLTVAKTKGPKPGVDSSQPFMVGFNIQTCQFKEVQ